MYGVNFLDSSVSFLIDTSLKDVNTCLPAIVLKFDKKTKTCMIQPSIKRRFKDGRSRNLPIINNVPVLYPKSGDKFIYFPLNKNDKVILLFSQRALEEWKEKDGIVEAGSKRKFDLSDALAIPAGYNSRDVPEESLKQDGIEITNKESYLGIKDSGEIEIKTKNDLVLNGNKVEVNFKKTKITNGAVDLIEELENLIDFLKNLMPVSGAPGQPAPLVIFGTPDYLKLTRIEQKIKSLR